MITDIELYQDWERKKAAGWNRVQFAHYHKIESLKSLENKLYRGKQEDLFLRNYKQVSPIPVIDDEIVVDGDAVVIGDVHVPFTNYGFAAYVPIIARQYLKRPRTLVVGGDFFDMDRFSQYQQVIEPPTWAQEREAAKALVHEWMDTFDKIYFTMGNHDRRLQKFTAGAFETVDILSLIVSNPDRVRMSNRGYCIVNSGGVEWRVTHPKNYSINQLNVADTVANKYGSNIISFHEHHLAKGWDRYKHYVIVNGGCLVDHKKLAYVSLDDSKSAGMALGFVVLRNGTPYLFGEEPFTDWSAWVR